MSYAWPTPREAVEILGIAITPEQFLEAFTIEGPANISFSGGRTSAVMLWCHLVAHGGVLPDEVRVVFANTGKERLETLRFVHDCATAWGVHVTWVEWRPKPKEVEGRPTFADWMARVHADDGFADESGFAEVGFNSASRAGEPFLALIAMKQFAPNAVTRFCSVVLKVRAAASYCRAQGWKRWTNIIGLRADEGWRVMKALARNDSGKEPFKAAMPLAKARIHKRHVLAFWWGAERTYETRTKPQGFDLELRDYEGNCDLCFLKSKAKKLAIIREQPGSAQWWIEAEILAKQKATGKGGRFVTEYSYADLQRIVTEQPHLFDSLNDDEEWDAECGLACGA